MVASNKSSMGLFSVAPVTHLDSEVQAYKDKIVELERLNGELLKASLEQKAKSIDIAEHYKQLYQLELKHNADLLAQRNELSAIHRQELEQRSRDHALEIKELHDARERILDRFLNRLGVPSAEVTQVREVERATAPAVSQFVSPRLAANEKAKSIEQQITEMAKLDINTFEKAAAMWEANPDKGYLEETT